MKITVLILLAAAGFALGAETNAPATQTNSVSLTKNQMLWIQYDGKIKAFGVQSRLLNAAKVELEVADPTASREPKNPKTAKPNKK